MCGADCWTGQTIVSKLTLSFQPQRRPQGKKRINMLNVTKLTDKSFSEDLTRELNCKLPDLHLGQATIQKDWVGLRYKIHDTALSVTRAY